MIKESYYRMLDAGIRAYDLKPKYGFISEGLVNCDHMPCPKELDNWTGVTSSYEVYDENDNVVALIAYYE